MNKFKILYNYEPKITLSFYGAAVILLLMQFGAFYWIGSHLYNPKMLFEPLLFIQGGGTVWLFLVFSASCFYLFSLILIIYFFDNLTVWQINCVLYFKKKVKDNNRPTYNPYIGNKVLRLFYLM